MHTSLANGECVRCHGGILSTLTQPPLPARLFQLAFQVGTACACVLSAWLSRPAHALQAVLHSSSSLGAGSGRTPVREATRGPAAALQQPAACVLRLVFRRWSCTSCSRLPLAFVTQIPPPAPHQPPQVVMYFQLLAVYAVMPSVELAFEAYRSEEQVFK